MSLRALIFDVDGTLADTEEAHRQAFNGAFAQAGLSWYWTEARYGELLAVTGGKERLAAFIATLDLDAAERERHLAAIPALHRAKTDYYAGLVATGRVALRPGIARLVADARAVGLTLAIATTTTLDNVHALLRGTLGAGSFGWFAAIGAGDAVPRKKPAPDVYHYVFDVLGLEARECVAFEDSAAGLAAAHGAGLATVVTPCQWTEQQDFSDADLLLPHLGDGLNPLPADAGLPRAATRLELAHLEALLERRAARDSRRRTRARQGGTMNHGARPC
ncbi:MAG: HAD-IA family hydrolase [Gammaproteobacteria bacterium]